MSLLDDLPVEAPAAPTSTSTTPRAFFRRHRAVLGVALLLVAALVLLVVSTGVGKSGSLDPDSYEPTGGHALASVLRDHGVRVTRTVDLPTTLAGLDERSTVLVPNPDELTESELQQLGAAVSTGAQIIVVQPDSDELSELGVTARVDDFLDTRNREPGCGLAAAVSASTADLGGLTYSAESGEDVQRCYSGIVLAVGHVVTIGSGGFGGGAFFDNEHLAKQGNAELALSLLGLDGGQRDDVRWLIPDSSRVLDGTLKPTSLNDLLPRWVKAGVIQLAIAVVVLALWRGRRLGRVVVEPLPIVVRAAETVEGRGRLYRAAGSRATAAEALRSGTRERIGQRLGAGRGATPEVVVELIVDRTSRPATDVQALLYGPPPVDDAALVRLASDLDSLTQEVAGS